MHFTGSLEEHARILPLSVQLHGGGVILAVAFDLLIDNLLEITPRLISKFEYHV